VKRQRKDFKPTIAFRVPLRVYERLQALAEESGGNLSEAARKAIRASLERGMREEKVMGQRSGAQEEQGGLSAG